MTEIFVTCGKCIPEKIKENIPDRTILFSEGQTTIWACVHVVGFRAVYPAKYVRLQ